MRGGTRSDVLFALCMEVYSRDRSFDLVEADIVEALKAGARDGSHPVIGDEEVLLPAHEYMFPLGEIAVGEVRALRLFRQRSPSGEPCPVVHVGLLRGTPFFVPGLERMFRADNLPFKKGGQGWVVFGEA